MHAYRDALLGARGCYVLYPGEEEKPELFIRHGSLKYRENNVIPGVGAFPLKPGKFLSQQQGSIQGHFKSDF